MVEPVETYFAAQSDPSGSVCPNKPLRWGFAPMSIHRGKSQMSFRRITGILFATASLVLVPSAALAGEYPGDPEDVIVTDTNPAPGEPFNVIVDGGPESDEVTLTVTSNDPGVSDDDIEIAGTQSMTKAATGGVAEFTVTLYVEGRYTLVGFDEAGNRVGETIVVVGDGTAGESGTAGEGAGGAGAGGAVGGLGATGADDMTMLIGGAGVLLLAGGGLALVAAHRRRSHVVA